MTFLLRMMSAIRARLRALFRRGAVEREMHDEMARHLEEATRRFVRRGMSAAEARDAARREFGNVAYLQEESRDARGGRWIESLLGDVRFAFRHFARTPLTTITLVLVLSLGIGVNSALFSILQSVTMRPAPGVPSDDALVRVRGTTFSRTEGELRARGFSMLELNRPRLSARDLLRCCRLRGGSDGPRPRRWQRAPPGRSPLRHAELLRDASSPTGDWSRDCRPEVRPTRRAPSSWR